MKEILITLILATCPKSHDGKLTVCHEFFINCAITGAGEIKAETMRTCSEKWRREHGE